MNKSTLTRMARRLKVIKGIADKEAVGWGGYVGGAAKVTGVIMASKCSVASLRS